MQSENVDTRQVTVAKLRRDVAVVIALKVIVILLAAFFVFGASQRMFVNADVMATHIVR